LFSSVALANGHLVTQSHLVKEISLFCSFSRLYSLDKSPFIYCAHSSPRLAAENCAKQNFDYLFCIHSLVKSVIKSTLIFFPHTLQVFLCWPSIKIKPFFFDEEKQKFRRIFNILDKQTIAFLEIFTFDFVWQCFLCFE
jgi:hypothetical protein